eukprot:CAMPEP_0119269796 /NCGR_PEP_ID=MMETSP1329-20130426/7057_1 /TAXON_ID=114041 /ORGANISM="Genus nov. species nov., Strain RCC1024" /LENGTH=93 /DNA_ID=CAMNT_0007269797 /DNA_START=96 /DNA_END=374 /DNA_ORIENTATION=+
MSFAAARLLARTAPIAARSAAVAPRRAMSGAAKKPAAELTFKEAWLSDPATYPIVVIISGACVFCFSVCMRCLFTNPDVRISKTARSQVIRDW